MTSKIINMAEKIKDEEDRVLEALFASGPVADDGFSDQLLHRIRRRLWIRRLILPTAVVVGAVIAFKPLLAAATIVLNLAAALPLDLTVPVSDSIPPLQTILLGGLLLGVGLFSIRLVQE